MHRTSPLFVFAIAALASCSSSNGTSDGMNPGDDGGTPPGADGALPPGADGALPPGVDGSVPPGTDGSVPPGTDGSVPPGKDGSTPAGRIKTVFLILMENHNWSDIKGNTASAPYINNTLLPMASRAESYYDNPKKVHPSEPNYIWLEAGDNLGITTDSDPATNHQSTTQHLVTMLTAAGVSWHAWTEDITAGTCPLTSTGLFGAKHTPMLFFDDVVGNPPSKTAAACTANIVPFTGFAAALSSGNVPQYNFITPNLCDDMHGATGCPSDLIKAGDDWLAANVPTILGSQAYKNDGALFITWDESEGGEFPIGMIVLSPKAKGGGYANTATTYYHSSMLRTVQEIFSVTPLLRDAANQPNLSDLFTSFP